MSLCVRYKVVGSTTDDCSVVQASYEALDGFCVVDVFWGKKDEVMVVLLCVDGSIDTLIATLSTIGPFRMSQLLFRK